MDPKKTFGFEEKTFGMASHFIEERKMKVFVQII